MIYPTIDWMKRIYDYTEKCILPDSYAYVFFQWIYFSVQNDARRCDTFLGLAMASIRTFVLKFPIKSCKATNVSFGWKCCLIIFVISSIISSAHILRTKVVPVGYIEWECYERYSNETSGIVYSLVPSTLAVWNNFLLPKIAMVIEGIFTKIIPAVLFPILTFLLTVELRKIEESRRRMFSNRSQNKNSATTKFVIFNTIAYVISTFPSSIFHFIYTFFSSWCIEVECYNYPQLLEFLTSFITLTHFPICLAMSTQYRSTILGLLRFKKESGTTVIKANSISGNPT
ncbi:hypothetical protein L3Y34_019428 [Caenorhabditis briggsae]|uniref:G-protein coupled receptors family 1 profile domain-containing protein n=1 Tax=Caenorhabditis briggsae TaxID=6238 RepID=A0AAE9DN68_CAEBR|nr:hypothetical protein L3Y34_019428 [Caenorhabditis briggsae]